MHPFTLVHPADKASAIRAAADGDSKFIAGGTNLVDLMKMYVEQPRKVVSIPAEGLEEITVMADGGVRVGAIVCNSDMAYHPYIKEHYPMLSEALLSGASPQLRNMSTTGGNLLQRTRCPYFFNTTMPCNKREPGSGCSAIKGYNRMHAVLGTSEHCIATHPSDMCVALIALGAIIHIEGPEGNRQVPMAEFHLLPRDTPHIETVLKQGELITGVEIPALPFATRSHYLKVRDRASYEFALASAAVALDIDSGTIKAARIALGGVGTKPWRAYEAEKALEGASLSNEAFRAAANAALKDAVTHQHNAFKPELARRTLIQALQTTGGLS